MMAVTDKLEQGRAEFAYQCAAKGSALDKKKEYKQYVKKLPMLIKTNGLGAAVAFFFSKKNDDQSKAGYAYKEIYEQLNEWLKKAETVNWMLNSDKPLVQSITELPSEQYRALTIEALAFLNWLRRFAEGMIEGEAEE